MKSSSYDAIAVIVYQHSMPWLDVTLSALLTYKNEHKLGIILVENIPNSSEGSKAAARAFVPLYLKKTGCHARIINCNISKIADPGARHAGGLAAGYAQAKEAPKVLFMDSDCIPIRDGWLDRMFDADADIVGPPSFHNLPDYTIPHAHPSLLLFNSELAGPPYWNGSFLQVRRHPDTGVKIFWDVCIGFTHRVGSRPDVSLKKLPQRCCTGHGYEYYRIDDIAIHMRGTTNVTKRKYPKDQKRGLLVLPEFNFYKQHTVKP